MVISFLAYVATFPGQLYFRGSYSRLITSTQKLLFGSTCFFRASTFFDKLLLQTSYFFAAVIFSEWLLFESEMSSHHLRIGSSLGYLLFGTATSLAEELFRMKISTESYFFEAGTSAEHQLIQKSYILEKSEFFRKAILHYPFFLESYLFRVATFSKDVIFYRSHLFRRATFLQHTFSKELPFHCYASYLPVSN